MGHALTIPFTQIQEQSDWISTLTTVQVAGFTTLALTPARDALDIEQIAQETAKNMLSAPKLALMLGAEGPGLTPESIQAASNKVKIPLASTADSLNISVAAAVALHRLIPPQG